MNSQEKINEIVKNKDWFVETGTDQFGNIVVYVTKMSHEIFTTIPDAIDNSRVLVHFASHKNASRDDYIVNENEPFSLSKIIEELPDEELRTDPEQLILELDRIEEVCGVNVLEDLFYEIHDGANTLTNLSVKFPEIKNRIQKLYDEYGFDVIYEFLEG